MGLKRYIIGSIVFIIIVGWIASSQHMEPLTMVMVGLPPITFSLAVWIIIPLSVLFLTSLSHMIYYSFKNFITNRTQKKDIDNFKTMVENKILNKNTHYNFLTNSFKEIGELSVLLKFDEKKSSAKVSNEEINNFLKLINTINGGDIADLKKYKLDYDNPLCIKNRHNMLKNNPKEAKNIIKTCKDLNSPICEEAFLNFVIFANKNEIKDLTLKVRKNEFSVIIDRYIKNDIDLNLEDIIYFLEGANYNDKDYISLAKKLKEKLTPDAAIVFFDKLYAKFPQALESYLYLLFELQMVDTIREIVQDCDNKICQKYKHLLFLRDNGKNFNIELFT